MIRYEIIFTVDKGPIHLSPEHTFFALPRDAVTECLTDTSKVTSPIILLIIVITFTSCYFLFSLNLVVFLKIHNVLVILILLQSWKKVLSRPSWKNLLLFVVLAVN